MPIGGADHSGHAQVLEAGNPTRHGTDTFSAGQQATRPPIKPAQQPYPPEKVSVPVSAPLPATARGLTPFRGAASDLARLSNQPSSITLRKRCLSPSRPATSTD